jgi:hypothetical protein
MLQTGDKVGVIHMQIYRGIVHSDRPSQILKINETVNQSKRSANRHPA